MNSPAKILLIEDNEDLGQVLRELLAGEGYAVTVAARGDEGLALAEKGAFEVVISDIKLPGLDGLELVRRLHAAQPRLPIILATGHGTTETAIEATKLGAFDYLLKPFETAELIRLTHKAIQCGRLMSKPVALGDARATPDAIIGASRAMQSIYKEIGRVAAKPVTVLIRGETGAGKELVARALYQHSDRAGAPFIAINCAAIPETLLESELFGHERGAFTGAAARRIGRFEQANKGTIFLDEIGDMTPNTQVKLLRVLQDHVIQRLGSEETIPVDIRVIAATHRDLEAAMQQRQFREDLFFRLSVAVISLPPLRERREDIPELVRYFVEKYSRELGYSVPAIGPESMQFLQSQNWPGNVRELENAVRKTLLQTRGYPVDLDDVKAVMGKSGAPATPPAHSLRDVVGELLAAAQRGEIQDAHGRLLESAEQELFRQAIELAGGNQAKAARWVGVSRLTMREKLTHFGLHPRKEEDAES